MTIALDARLTELEDILQAICVKCRSNVWGPETPRKAILNNFHDIASSALSGDMERAFRLAATDVA